MADGWSASALDHQTQGLPSRGRVFPSPPSMVQPPSPWRSGSRPPEPYARSGQRQPTGQLDLFDDEVPVADVPCGQHSDSADPQHPGAAAARYGRVSRAGTPEQPERQGAGDDRLEVGQVTAARLGHCRGTDRDRSQAGAPGPRPARRDRSAGPAGGGRWRERDEEETGEKLRGEDDDPETRNPDLAAARGPRPRRLTCA